MHPWLLSWLKRPTVIITALIFIVIAFLIQRDERTLKVIFMDKMILLSYKIYKVSYTEADGTIVLNWDNIDAMLQSTRDDTFAADRWDDINVTVSESLTNDIRVFYPLNYDAKGQTKYPIVVWIYGGGFTMGGPWMYHPFLVRLNEALPNALVIAINYRKGPQYRFPTAINDIWDHIVWIHNNADTQLNGDISRIIIAGHSAGALSSIISAARNIESDASVSIIGQYLDGGFCNALTMRETESWDRYGNGGYLISKEGVMFSEKAYLESDEQLTDPRYSPCMIADDILAQLPVTLLDAHEWDVVRDSGLELGSKLQSLGVDIEIHTWAKTTHTVTTMCDVFSDECNALTSRLAEWVEQRFEQAQKQEEPVEEDE